MRENDEPRFSDKTVLWGALIVFIVGYTIAGVFLHTLGLY